MAAGENTGGTLTTDGSEQTLATLTTVNFFELVVDLSAMTLTDEVELRIYTKVRTGAPSTQEWMQPYKFVQCCGVTRSPPIFSHIEYKATLKRVAGSVTNIVWSIRQLT